MSRMTKLRESFYRFTDPETCETLLGQVKEEKQTATPSCPHCESLSVVRYGKYRDRQRYKCKDCTRTFNDFTNTPLHRTHYPEKWIKFLECMMEGHSLQLSALIVGVSYVTLFYWRHKLIQALNKLDSSIEKSRARNYGLKKKYIWVYVYPPTHVISYEKRDAFTIWIRKFVGIAQKYLERYVAWFNFVEKEKPTRKKMLDGMSSMLLNTCSLSFEQTYSNLRMNQTIVS